MLNGHGSDGPDRGGLLGLWSVPRGRSTAFFRMMRERGDHVVLFEPFVMLHRLGSMTVGDITAASDAALAEAMQHVAARSRVFFKMTGLRHIDLASSRDFLRSGTHTFLIREPKAVISSLFAMSEKLSLDVSRENVGFERLTEIYDAVAEETGRRPVLINSDELLADPPGIVREYCAAVGIPFIPESLCWETGALPEYKISVPWHELTMRSTGFSDPGSQYEDTTDNNPMLAEYLEYNLPLYQRLNEHRLTVSPRDN